MVQRSGYVVRLLIVLSVCVLLSLSGALVVQAQGPNLLQNPGFERPYVTLGRKENCRIAAPWVAYYYEGAPSETREGYRLAPEYKAAFYYEHPGNRVHSGELAQQYFHSWGNFEGGVLQQVNGVRVGDRLRLDMWAMTWSCDNEKKSNCSKATSGDPSPMHLRIGIDPTGGTDAKSPNIIWSAEQNAYDAWHLLSVEAKALRSTVTVFAYSYPDYRSQDNNVYLDDASLISLGRWTGPDPVPGVPTAETAMRIVTVQPSGSAPAATTQWPITGSLAGNAGGAFASYDLSFPAMGQVTLKAAFSPYDRVLAKGVGMAVYGPQGEVAKVAGNGQASFAPVAGAKYELKVYNYVGGVTVGYSIDY
jgi:hypothetical protein